jgi:hypothetical protein
MEEISEIEQVVPRKRRYENNNNVWLNFTLPRFTLRKSIIREGSVMGISKISDMKHLALQRTDW